MDKTLGADRRRLGGKFARARAYALVVAALPAGFALSGCSVSMKPHSAISPASLESNIAQALSSSYNIPRPQVSCPREVPARIGTRVTCSTELDGQTLAVLVTVTAAHGRANLRPTSAVVTKGKAEAQLAQSLAARLGHNIQVFCSGPGLLVVKPGGTFNCTADVSGFQRRLLVTVTNLAGEVRYQVLPFAGPPAAGA